MAPANASEEPVVRSGHLHLRSEAEFAIALRAETPRHPARYGASADVTSAPNSTTRTRVGVSDRSAPVCEFKEEGGERADQGAQPRYKMVS
jgi:hypothetical protein